MAFISTKTLKALSTKMFQGAAGAEQAQAPMQFFKPSDLMNKLANESTADEGCSSSHQQSCSSESEWETEASRARACSSASEAPKPKVAPWRPRVATEPAAVAEAPSNPRARASTLGSNANAWTSRRSSNASQTPEQKIQRAVRAVLNKLTIEKFEPLYETLVSDCGLSEPEHMSIVMSEVFEKATTQHHFIEMYADLCVRLESDPFLECARGKQGQPNSFRHLLLTQCQLAFERLLSQEEPSKSGSSDEDQQELETARRRRALGNVKLVGHLMVRGMLSSRLLVACCDALLRGEKTCPEALESLAALLTVAGKTFDGKKEWQYSDRLNAIFAKIDEFTKEKRVPARSRFLFRDLLDLRAAGWPSQGRPAVAKETPKTLDAIQAEWEAAQPSQAQTWSQPTRAQLSAAAPEFVPRSSQAAAREEPKPKPAAAPAAPAKEQRPWHKNRKAEATSADAALQEALAKAASMAEEQAQPAAKPAAAPAATQVPGEFNLKVFRKDLAATLKQLSLDRNVAAAVRRVRGHQVPEKCQAREMTDLLTRAAEESRGPIRRSAFAFACGLGVADPPAFSRAECLKGVQAFFEDVASELVEEVPRLPQWIAGELVPTLKSVFPEDELKAVLPAEHQ